MLDRVTSGTLPRRDGPHHRIAHDGRGRPRSPDPPKAGNDLRDPFRLQRTGAGQLTEQAAASGRSVDVQDASTPNAQTPAALATWQKRNRASQYLVPLASGANIVLNASRVQTSRPGGRVRSVVRTLLPG